MLCHGYGTFLAGLVNGGFHLFHPAYTRQLEHVVGLVQFLRHMAQRNL
jgi:hypothetical protein